MNLPQSLRRNQDRYLGETIDIRRVLARVQAAAEKQGWTATTFLNQPGVNLSALHRPGKPADHRVYLSTGIHGDEPAGPLAVLELLEENCWPANIEFWLFPCLNPSGFPINTRANASGCDLNRDYRQPTSAEVQAHTLFLERLPTFDAALCLHEDWEAKGFYLYELNATGGDSRAEAIIKAVADACPIDLSEDIEGRRAERGIIRPEINPANRPEWPEAFYLFQHHTQLSYTLEAPSDFALSVRVAALKIATRTALQAFADKT